MPQPYDYRLNLPDPTQNLLNTVATAQGIQQLKTQRQQAEATQQQTQQLQADLASLYESPTTSNVAKVMTRNPQLAQQFEKTYGVLSQEEQKDKLNQASQVYAALEADKPEIAKSILQRQAEAYRNVGDEKQAKIVEDLSKLVEMSPQTAKTSTGLFLASAMGSDKFTETFTKLQGERREEQLQSSKLTEAQAKANKAAIESKYAESKAAMELSKKGWDIYKLQEDVAINKENSKIAALNAKLKKETNELKKQELEQKLLSFQNERDEKLRTKAAEVETTRSNIDNMLNTIDSALGYDDETIADATGTIQSRLFTLDQDVADFETEIENIDAQAFLSQVPQMKGLGALSENEGKKLSAALRNLSLRQSDAKLKDNLREAQRLMLKARKNISTKYGVPDTIPDRPNVPTPQDVSGDNLPAPDTSGFKVLGVESP